jgi:pectate lyase
MSLQRVQGCALFGTCPGIPKPVPSGNLVQRNNFFVNSGTPMTNGSVASIPYAYTMDAASSVKSIVTAGAGTGKLGL